MLRNWDPFAELNRFTEDMNRRLTTGNGNGRLAFRPAVDIFEDQESIQLHAELPGMKPDDVHVSVEDGVLTIRGERKLEKEEKKDGYHRVERSYGSFARSFSLPDNLDSENIHAEMKDGVLELKLMKRAKPEPKRVQIKS